MKTIIPALIKAQREFPAVIKDSNNPHFKNTYASLESVLEAVTPTLCKNGLAILQTYGISEGQPTLKTILAHESGETIEGEQPLLMAKQDAQALAGASTYARRYGILAILSLAAEDDDGLTATRPPPPKPPAHNQMADLQEFAITTYESVKAAGKTTEALDRWADDIMSHTKETLNSGIIRMKAIIK